MRWNQTSGFAVMTLTLVVSPLLLARPALCEGVAFGPLDRTQGSTESRRGRMVQHIDSQLRQLWQRAGVEPAAPASDGDFLRRASLDLNGVIPRVWQVRQYQSDHRSDKRQQLVQRLLTSPRYATHMATVWRNRILPPSTEATHPREALGLQSWLRTRFAKNLRYDGLVAGLLLATGDEALGAALYFQALDVAPEKLAASVSELFLGVQLQCAQCHDHPQGDWSQLDFWGLAAFFAQVEAPEVRGMEMSYRLLDTKYGEVQLPDTDQIVAPKYLHSPREIDDSLEHRRAAFVLWLTSRDNLLFAQAGVNWAWTHLFGRGLVESLPADLEPTPSIQARLLVDLAAYFVESGFDLQELLRLLASTSAYQLSNWHADPQLAAPELFARMLPKPLTPEQLYDSFLQLAPTALGGEQAVRPVNTPPQALAANFRKAEFVRQMREPPGNRTEYRAGTLQALMLMNGEVMAELTAHDRSRMLGALTAPFLDDVQRIDTLFLATLGRRPDPEQRQMCLAQLHSVETETDRSRVLSDLLWALVNSTEFAFNR